MTAARRRATPNVAIITAAACLLGAEGIHTAAMGIHWREWWAEGMFFLAISVLEGALAAWLLVAPSRRLGRAVIAVSAGTVAVWAWSRTIGVPLGPMAGTAEPIEVADATATLLEAMTVLSTLPLAVGRAQPSAAEAVRPGARLATAVAIGMVALLTVFGSANADHHDERSGHAAPEHSALTKTPAAGTS